MGQPTWREIDTVTVPGASVGAWTPVLDYVTPGKLYRIAVEKIVQPQLAAVTPDGSVTAGAAVSVPGTGAPAVLPPIGSPAPTPSLPVSVPTDQLWTPDGGSPCSADGDPALTRTGTMTLDTCAPGALIARVGGSSADLKVDRDKTVVFGVGKYCVFSIADAAKAGCLYLSINDTQVAAAKVKGQLQVTLSEAL